jgi:hypothetical protein
MLKKIILAAVILCVILVVGLQFFLAYGLTDSLRKWVLPAVKAKYDTDVSVRNISVNLLGGTLNVHGIQVANPPGFDEPALLAIENCGLKVGLPALFRAGGADIQKAVLKNVSLAIVRDKNGALNLDPLLNAMQSPERTAGSGGGAAGAGEDAADPARASFPNITVKKMEMAARLNYFDWQIGQPFKLGIETDLQLSNIANYGLDDSLSGIINLRGHILENGRKCAFDLNGRISPIADPLTVSFDLSGSMQTLDLQTFKEFIENIGLKEGKASGTINLVCRKGRFDPEKSVLRLKLSNIVPTEEKAKKMGGIPMPATLNIIVPVSGPLSNPQINVAEAFFKSMTSEDTVNSILQGIIDSKTEKDQNLEKGGKQNDKSGSKTPAPKISEIKSMFGDILGGADK